MKRKLNSKKIMAIVLACCFVMMTGCGKKATSEPNESSSSESSTSSSEPVELRDPIKLGEKIDKGIERNDDTIGWLTLPETGIDDAVLQRTDPEKSHEENNSYYLKMDEDKNWNVFSCYWADPYSKMGTRDDLSRNTVIYGHSDYKDNKDGKRFSKLFAYTDIDFLKNNPYIYFSTPEEDMVFQVFAVFYTHIDFSYILANPSDQQFTDIIKGAKERSEYIIDMPVGKDDKIITLSTCTGLFKPNDRNNYRYVVMGKLLPTSDVPVGEVEVAVNPNPKRD